MRLAILQYAFIWAISAWLAHFKFFAKLWFAGGCGLICWSIVAAWLAFVAIPLSFYIVVPLAGISLTLYVYYFYSAFIGAALALAEQKEPVFFAGSLKQAMQLALPHIVVLPFSFWLFVRYVGMGSDMFFVAMQFFTLLLQMLLFFYPYSCMSDDYSIIRAFKMSYSMMIRIPVITFALACLYTIAWFLTVLTGFVAGCFLMPLVFLIGAFIFKKYNYDHTLKG